MKGHIRERSPGHWAIVIDARDAGGKRKRRWFAFQGTKREAQRRCAELVTETRGGAATSPERMTVGQYLDRWLDHMRGRISPRTHERYSQMVRTHVDHLVGNHKLAKLTPMQVSAAYTTMMNSGLAPTTVRLVHRVFGQALRQAVEWRLIPAAPSTGIKLPRVERRQVAVWDPATMAKAIDLADGRQCRIPILLASLCGMRLGEIAALRWRHVLLERALIAVVEAAEETDAGVRIKPPKSGRARSVTLPALAVAELRAWRAQQAERCLQFGMRPDEDTTVVTQFDGKPVPPSAIYKSWVRFLRATGLPRIRFHGLRHSHATALMVANVHPRIVSERLGHSSVGITLDTYSHVSPGMQEEVAAVIDAQFKRLR